jgi:hypothetical protein
MKKVFLTVAFLILLGGDSNLLAFQWIEDVTDASLAKRKELATEQFNFKIQTIKNPQAADLSQMRKIIEKGVSFSNEISEYCERIRSSNSVIDCYRELKKFTSELADLELDTAKFLVELGFEKEAKFYCRDVITRYTGDAYRSYVRRAEFCLEDL